MLPLLTDHIDCYLWPDKALLVKRRGWIKKTIVTKKWLHADGASIYVKLEQYIRLPEWRFKTNVVLCGGLVNYRLIKHDIRLNVDEHLAVAKHQFEQVYGQIAENWKVFIQSMRFEKNNLAVAVDPNVLQNIQATFKSVQIKLLQIRPCLAGWLNKTRKVLPKSGWVAFVDEQDLLLIRIEANELMLTKQQRSQNWLNDQIKQLLKRESIAFGEDWDSSTSVIFNIVDGMPTRIILDEKYTYQVGQLGKSVSG